MFYKSMAAIQNNKEKIYKLILLAILISSAFIYLFNLGRESLFTDEYFSFYLARQPLKQILLGHQSSTNPNTIPPLYETILHFWLKIFGMSAFTQRSLSALLGVLGVFLMYRLTRLLCDTPTGLIASLFASLSFSWFSFFRQNRCYSLFICLTLLSFHLFFQLYKNKKQRSALIFLTITNIALVYTNYFGFLAILCQIIFGLLEAKKNTALIKKVFLMCLWVAFAYGPWYANLIYDIRREPLMSIKIYYPQLYLRILSIISVFFTDFHFRWEPVLTLIYIPFIVRGWLRLYRQRDNYARYLFLLPFIVYCLTFSIIYSFTLSDRIRYYAAFSFPLFILLAVGMRNINTRGIRKIFLLLIFSFISVFNFTDFREFLTYSLNEDWKLAAQYVKQISDYKNKNMVFVFQTKYNPPVFAYYYWDTKVADTFINNIPDFQNYEGDLSAVNTKHRIYLISEEANDKRFFEKIGLFPDDTWIWLFRYHDPLASFYLRIYNEDKYFLHQFPLNPELQQIDLYLLKKIKK